MTHRQHIVMSEKSSLPNKIILLVLSVIITMASSISYKVVCTRYTLTSDKITDSLKLAIVADFHGCRYDRHSESIIQIISAEQPDAVLLCGDIYDDKLPFQNSDDLVGQLAEKWPVYYVSGNHEYWSKQIDSIKAKLTSYGVNVLEGTSKCVPVRKDTILIGGIDDPTYLGLDFVTRQAQNIHYSPNHYSILLSHRPELTELFSSVPADLVVSGHAHGGQVRIPWLLDNGLIAPNQGLFPKYTYGIHYLTEQKALVISRGLAKESTRVPRVFNKPEIVSVTVNSSR